MNLSPATQEAPAGRGGFWLRMAAGAILLAGAVYFMTLGRPWLERFLGFVRTLGPFWFYLVFAGLSSVGAPTSPFLVVAGASFDLASNVVGMLASYSVNLAATYYLGRGLFAEWPRRMMAAARLPWRLPEEASWRVIVLVRMTPGIPFVVQSFLLASMCPRFWPYYIFSAPCALFMAGLMLFLGTGLGAGRFKQIALAVVLIVVAAVALRYVGGRLARRFYPAAGK